MKLYGIISVDRMPIVSVSSRTVELDGLGALEVLRYSPRRAYGTVDLDGVAARVSSWEPSGLVVLPGCKIDARLFKPIVDRMPPDYNECLVVGGNGGVARRPQSDFKVGFDQRTYDIRVIRVETLMKVLGSVASAKKTRKGKVIVGLASYPARENMMLEVVRRLAPQCDEMYVSLNEYEGDSLIRVSKKLDAYSNVVCTAYLGDEDLGCQNKFRAVDLCDDGDYFLSADDDIRYPEDYVDRLVSGIDRHGGEAICGFHGNIFHSVDGKVMANFKDKDILMYSGETREDREVNLCGMGVSGMMPKRIGVTFSVFRGKKNTGDDEMLAVWAERNGVKRFILRKPKNWLRELPHPKGSYKLCTDIGNRTARDVLLNTAEFKDLLPEERLSVTYVSDGSDETESDLLASVNSLAANSGCRVTVNLVCTKVSGFARSYINARVDSLNVIEPPNWMVERCFEANKEAIALGKASATSIALLKFELADLVTGKATLFLDNDTIVNRSLTELATLQKSDNLPIVSAVMDRWAGISDKARYPVHQNLDYFNTGVMLLNLELMRSSHVHDSLWEAKRITPEKHLVDQNAFNIVFTGVVRLMDGRWNTASVATGAKDANIIHFCGKAQKPRKYPMTRNANIWFKYEVQVKPDGQE